MKAGQIWLCRQKLGERGENGFVVKISQLLRAELWPRKPGDLAELLWRKDCMQSSLYVGKEEKRGSSHKVGKALGL